MPITLKANATCGDTALRWLRIAGRMSDEQLAQAMLALVTEYTTQPRERREVELQAAQLVWPELRASLRAMGRQISSVSYDGPRLVPWCFYPVAACHGFHGKPAKSKREALTIALTVGDHWATVGELWQWVRGTGPIVERTMHGLGYGGPGPAPLSVRELYPFGEQ